MGEKKSPTLCSSTSFGSSSIQCCTYSLLISFINSLENSCFVGWKIYIFSRGSSEVSSTTRTPRFVKHVRKNPLHK
uniref:Ovule protein n=1 Tax=Ascaris lumbricoides TaxID=6252 RepID=A0A0M3II01_ASCLU